MRHKDIFFKKHVLCWVFFSQYWVCSHWSHLLLRILRSASFNMGGMFSHIFDILTILWQEGNMMKCLGLMRAPLLSWWIFSCVRPSSQEEAQYFTAYYLLTGPIFSCIARLRTFYGSIINSLENIPLLEILNIFYLYFGRQKKLHSIL